MKKDEEAEIEDQSWWSREEMFKLLQDQKDSNNFYKLLIPFDEKITRMEVIQKNGVYKRILDHGSGSIIQQSNAIVYHYTAYLEGLNEPFDSSILRGNSLSSIGSRLDGSRSNDRNIVNEKGRKI